MFVVVTIPVILAGLMVWGTFRGLLAVTDDDGRACYFGVAAHYLGIFSPLEGLED